MQSLPVFIASLLSGLAVLVPAYVTSRSEVKWLLRYCSATNCDASLRLIMGVSCRLQQLLHWGTALEMILVGILMICEIYTNGDAHQVEWPSFGFVRPLIMLILQPLCGLCLYHPAFRWMVSSSPHY
jgi:hypothetical protein